MLMFLYALCAWNGFRELNPVDDRFFVAVCSRSLRDYNGASVISVFWILFLSEFQALLGAGHELTND